MLARLLAVKIVVATLLISACSTTSSDQTFEQRAAAFYNNPQTQAAIHTVEQVALQVGTQALLTYATGGSIDGAALAAAALNGSAAVLRSYEDPAVSTITTAAVANAVTTGAGVPGVSKIVAPKVAPAVAQAVQAGVSQDVALEVAARSLDQVAAKQGAAANGP